MAVRTAAAGFPAHARLLADAPAPSGGDWRDTGASVDARVRLLLDQLTVDEKIGQLDATTHPTGAVPRLGIPAFQGWNGARQPPARHLRRSALNGARMGRRGLHRGLLGGH